MPRSVRPWNLLLSAFVTIPGTRFTFSLFYSRIRRPLAAGVGALSIFIFGFGVDAFGQATRTWTGPAGGGLWTTNTNWSGNVVPIAADNVIISGDLTGAITAIPTISLGNLTISGNCTFQGSASGNTITVTGIFTVASGKTFIIGNPGGRVNFTLSGSGTISGTATMNQNATTRTFLNNGDLTITSTGLLDGVMA